MKKFTKKDLKTGMVVELTNGEMMIVINDFVIGIHHHMSLDRYTDDFEIMSKYKELNINRVWKQRDMTNFTSMFQTDWLSEDRFGHLLYSRDESFIKEDVEEMTMEEVCEALGKRIKIIP